MKQISGVPYNVKSEILARVTTKGKNLFERKNTVLVGRDLNSVPLGYDAVITDSAKAEGDKPIVYGVRDIDDFNEGDVVLINTNGEITFYYEINSLHNALFVTELCNHRCIMCPQPPVAQEEDKTQFNLKLISLIDKNAAEIGITGGEPTLLGDKLFDIIRAIVSHTPKAAVSLLSNGVKFSENLYAAKLASCNCRDLQVDVPIFSDIADEHNHIVGANTFYKTVQGLYNLATYRVPIGLRIVVHKLNYTRLPYLARFIYHNFPFVNQVAFLQMETTGMADRNINDLWIDPYDYNSELQKAVEFLSVRRMNVKIYNAQLCVLPDSIREYACASISDWKDIYLSQCTECKAKEMCGGLFASNDKWHSRHIAPLAERDQNQC